MPNYKLRYFDVRGRAEVARLLFTQAGVKFEDIRVRREDWPALKPTTPFGQMPILEVDGRVFAQSVAIANFLARELNLYGRSNIEKTLIDQIVCLSEDFFTAMVKARFEQDEAKKAELMKAYTEEVVPRFLGFFETLLAQNEDGRGFFVGKGVTMADIYVYNLFYDAKYAQPSILDKTPKLQGHHERVANLPNIKAYVETRPRRDM